MVARSYYYYYSIQLSSHSPVSHTGPSKTENDRTISKK